MSYVTLDESVTWDCSFAVVNALAAVSSGWYGLHDINVVSAAVRGKHGWIAMWPRGRWSRRAALTWSSTEPMVYGWR